MLRILTAVCMVSALVALTSGCAGSHRSGEANGGAPRWLRSLAQRDAVLMRDSHPRRIRIRVGVPVKQPPFAAGGHANVIELWGRFACAPTHGCNLIASCGPVPTPGHHHSCIFRGRYARLMISPRTHRLMSFELLHHA